MGAEWLPSDAVYPAPTGECTFEHTDKPHPLMSAGILLLFLLAVVTHVYVALNFRIVP